MSDKMRWRYGETNPVVAQVDSATTIDVGDLVYLTNGKAKSAAAFTPETTIAATQTAFAAAFLGVAMQKSVAGSTAPIRIATSGIFEFDAPSDTYTLGDTVGIYESADEVALENQKVDKVADASDSLGRVARIEASASSVILIAVRSVIMNGAAS